jgi:hypothetical protein
MLALVDAECGCIQRKVDPLDLLNLYGHRLLTSFGTVDLQASLRSRLGGLPMAAGYAIRHQGRRTLSL